MRLKRFELPELAALLPPAFLANPAATQERPALHVPQSQGEHLRPRRSRRKSHRR